MKSRPTKKDGPHLTPREKEIAALVLRGDKRDAMASALGIAVRTVDFHLNSLREKFCVGCLVTLALRLR